MTDINNRIDRERQSYDEGSVHEESAKLHGRYKHLCHNPNYKRLESYYETEVARLAQGAEILDYGCYDGWMVPHYQSFNPKKITGIDISEKGIASAKEHYGHLAEFKACDAHVMPFQNETFDLVVGRAILHHLDFNVALKEICRVLRPGGSAVFIEPLGDNPASKLFRRLNPKSRTVDEAPLSRKQIIYAEKIFGGPTNHFYANLVSTPVAMITSLLPLRNDNTLLKVSDLMDRLLAHTPLKYWMRLAMLSWSKKL